MVPIWRIKKCHENVVTPMMKSDSATRFDLSSVEDFLIPASKKSLIKTGLKMALSRGVYGRIAP